MSETSFPVNDLLRRKFQTGLVLAVLAMSVSSTLFLLLFADRIGFGFSLMAEDRMTIGFSMVFSRFMIFLGVLIFVVGAVIVSFMVFVMMSQKVRDIGLVKAAGCPNDLLFGYFFNELLIVTLGGCALGVVLGLAADFALTSLFSSLGLPVSQKSTNFWLVLMGVAIFIASALIFGAKPILNVTKIEPAKAISPVFHYGLSKKAGFSVVSRSGFTVKMAMRGLSRHKSATFRIVLCLTIVFLLVTVAIAGGMIADQTSMNWIEKGIGKDIVAIAHRDVCNQYDLLLSRFRQSEEAVGFNYTEGRYSLPRNLVSQLISLPVISKADPRIIMEGRVNEVSGYVVDPDTQTISPVGDSRQGESLIVGVERSNVLNDWVMNGRLMEEGTLLEAVIGDSIAQKMFSAPLNESIRLLNRTLSVVGVCLDPVNNGRVTYVPFKALQNATGISEPNLVMIRIDPSIGRAEALNEIRSLIKSVNVDFEVLELNEVLEKNQSFLNYLWSTVMFLPLFALGAASLCLIGYVTLTINEQRQEFGVLRAVGAKPQAIARIISGQSLIVSLSSCAAGIALGIMLTLLILVPEPIVTSYDVLEIAGWLLIALGGTFILSLYPTIRFAKKPILEIMTRS